MFAKLKNYRYLSLVRHQLFAVLILCLCLTLTALANQGDLDLTFDTDGKVTTSFDISNGDTGHSIAIQTDGKIVVGGSNGRDFALARYKPDGSLDPSFGIGGKVISPINFDYPDDITAIAIQADGKIVAVGVVHYSGMNSDFAVARFNTDGSLDTSFDFDGRLTTAITAGVDFATSVAVQTSGIITVAGASQNAGGNSDIAVVRYKPDGSLDGAFDLDGILTLTVGGINDQAYGVAIQTDGQIVVAGFSTIGANVLFAVVRLNPNGSPDMSFGTGGSTVTAVGPESFANAVVIQPNGFIVLAGSSISADNDFALVRYKPNGNLDLTFDGDGKVTTSIGGADDIANSVAIQSTGKIIAVGYTENGTDDDFALVRYNTDGSLDTGFGMGGKVITKFGTEHDDAYDVAIQADDKIVVAGSAFNAGGYDFAVARYVGAPPYGFLYVVNDIAAGNQIYGFSVNETSGVLTSIPGFPIATGGTGSGATYAEQITVDRAKNRLYVINDGSDTVSAYSINTTNGMLTALPFSPILLGDGHWATIAVNPTGSPLVVGDGDVTPIIRSYAITPTTATEAVGSPYSIGAGATPFSSVFSRDANFFYTGGNGSSFAVFSVAPATGVLTPLAGSPFLSGSNPVGYATDSQGRLFQANFDAGTLRVFKTSSGVPEAVTGNPFFSNLVQAADGVLHPSEQFYFVADRNFQNSSVGSYQISGVGLGTTLTAVAGSPFTSGGSFNTALEMNQTGTFLFAANGGSRNATTYAVNATNGILTNVRVQPADTLGTAGILTGIAYHPPPLAPTAASVSVGGRVTTASGRGISRARLMLTNQNGETRTALTSSFGWFRFDEIQVGETYIIEIRHKRYQFSPQVITVNDAIENLDFVADSPDFDKD